MNDFNRAAARPPTPVKTDNSTSKEHQVAKPEVAKFADLKAAQNRGANIHQQAMKLKGPSP